MSRKNKFREQFSGLSRGTARLHRMSIFVRLRQRPREYPGFTWHDLDIRYDTLKKPTRMGVAIRSRVSIGTIGPASRAPLHRVSSGSIILTVFTIRDNDLQFRGQRSHSRPTRRRWASAIDAPRCEMRIYLSKINFEDLSIHYLSIHYRYIIEQRFARDDSIISRILFIAVLTLTQIWITSRVYSALFIHQSLSIIAHIFSDLFGQMNSIR